MTIERVQRAAELRGVYFDGRRRWINNAVGYGYSVLTPRGYLCTDTHEGLYRGVMEFPRIDR